MYIQAAIRGVSNAMAWIGDELLAGNRMICTPQEGEKWLRKATEQGSTWGMQQLAYYILKGKIKPKHEDEARE